MAKRNGALNFKMHAKQTLKFIIDVRLSKRKPIIPLETTYEQMVLDCLFYGEEFNLINIVVVVGLTILIHLRFLMHHFTRHSISSAV